MIVKVTNYSIVISSAKISEPVGVRVVQEHRVTALRSAYFVLLIVYCVAF